MSKITIICPKCQSEVSVDQALEDQIAENFKKEFESKSVEKEKEIAALKEAMESQKTTIEEEVKKKVWAVAQEKAMAKVKGEMETEKKFLEESIKEKDKKIAEAQASELELRKMKNLLVEEKRTFELEKQRQLDEERVKIKEEALKSYDEERRLKDAEKEKLIGDMRKQIEDLRRKSEQGSQQTQGEVLELALEETFKTEFPTDEIVPVPKGINGADIMQKVIDQRGRVCGLIAWELKRTKAWSEGWVQKLKDDQRKIKADLGVIISEVLPEGVEEFGFRDGVYVSSSKAAISLARVLRLNLIQVASIRSLEDGKTEKKEIIYNYLCSAEFGNRIGAIVEASVAMKKVLDQEKRAYTKIWAEREKQIGRVEENMVGIYGDIKGIAGMTLPGIKSLELPGSEDEEVIPAFEAEDKASVESDEETNQTLF
ncbi:MAG: DUF2130 domain-containing protein [Candidatus Berkelbacteria bacterium]|nr:DUF2130 domain-containing protein [Candidatus Berkelbacteria bacterium]